jgi:hypothetical protein
MGNTHRPQANRRSIKEKIISKLDKIARVFAVKFAKMRSSGLYMITLIAITIFWKYIKFMFHDHDLVWILSIEASYMLTVFQITSDIQHKKVVTKLDRIEAAIAELKNDKKDRHNDSPTSS